MRDRLRWRYQELKGYVWDGYTAPELQPDIKSDQIIALMEEVERLEKRIDILEGVVGHLTR
jgi:hypothetical protein